MAAAAAAPAVAVLSYTPPARADLFGDIGVLLAQLEQQFQLVSNAIATVQNLVQTVEHLGHVVQYSKTLIQQATHGGVDGFLNAAQGFVGLARGITGNMQRINSDAARWTAYLTSTPRENISASDMQNARNFLVQSDQNLSKSFGDINKTYGRLDGSYKAMDAQVEAVRAAQQTEGVVGQAQIHNAMIGNQSQIMLHQDEVETMHAKVVTDDMMRQAEERRVQMESQKAAFEGFGKTDTSDRASLPYEPGNGWGWNDAP